MLVFDFGLHPQMLKTAMENQSESFYFKGQLLVKLELYFKVVFLIIP